MKLVSVAEMKAIEKEADANGLSYQDMMKNAGHGLADVVLDLGFDAPVPEILGLVGPGNNGGDTLVALQQLAAAGWKARAYLASRKPDSLVKQLEEAGGEILAGGAADKKFKALGAALESADVVLDGLLGTGAKPPLKEDLAGVLAAVGEALDQLEERPLIVAVDCPSGIDCDTGETPEECLPADLTVTMAAVKQGLLKLPAFEYVGNLQVVDIGLPEDLPALKKLQTDVAVEETVAGLLPERPVDAHKGSFGTALIAAGSVNFTGAALLAGQAAYRSGAGLVTLAVPSPLHSALAGQLPEATWVLLPHEVGVISAGAAEVLAKSFESATALLIGPGLGLEDTTKDFLHDLLTGKAGQKRSAGQMGFVPGQGPKGEQKNAVLPPLVIDADGLKLLARIPDWHKLLPTAAILTPHPGEMSILTGISKEEIQQDRQANARKFAAEWGHVVVLKGAFTVVAAPDGRLTVIPVASPALARAGTGDVLAGLIVGLRAQGVQAYEAAVAAAWIHAQAGLYAGDDLGTSAAVLAGDVLASIADVISDIT